MINIVEQILTFIFIFSVISLVRLCVNFFRALLSNPPKPFEFEKYETVTYGLFVSYIITYLINL
jgi:hypothetical protein